MQIERTSMKNPSKIDAFGRAGAVQGSSDTLRDASKNAPGREKIAPGALWGAPGHSKTARGASKSTSGPSWGRSGVRVERSQSVFLAASPLRTASSTICGHFGLVARKLRCAFRLSKTVVLWTSHMFRRSPLHAAKKLENRGVSASKNEPGSARGIQNRGPRGQIGQKNAP